MDKDKETEKTEEKKLRDLTPEKDAKGGAKRTPFTGPPITTKPPSTLTSPPESAPSDH